MKTIIDSPVVRWTLALIWTGLILILMLTPSDRPVVEDTSNTFGGTDLTDAVGHVILFGVLALIWWSVFACYGDVRPTFWLAMGFVAVLGVALEIAQYWVPERGVTVIDFVANILGVGLLIAVYRLWPGNLSALIARS